MRDCKTCPRAYADPAPLRRAREHRRPRHQPTARPAATNNVTFIKVNLVIFK
jgi:hypothetical protein